MAEEEEDISLIALTSHFAQVQFRLKQITSAPPEKRESLLTELEEFAFQGCPIKPQSAYDTMTESEKDSTEERRQRYLYDMLDQLQSQIHQTSKSKETTPTSPSSYQKESIIVDELKRRFHSQFDDLETMSEEEVRDKVGTLIKDSNETTTKDHLVCRLASQVRAMEDHISQLQHELATLSHISSTSHTPNDDIDIHYQVTLCQQNSQDEMLSLHHASSEESLVGPLPLPTRGRKKDPQNGVRALRRTLAIMHILTLWQCGGAFSCLPKSSSKLPINNRIRFPSAVRSLEISVDKISVLATALTQPGQDTISCVGFECDLHDAVSMNLADSLKELLEHGWEGLLPGPPTSCVPPLSWMRPLKLEGDSRDCNAWRTVLHYYNLKKGSKVCDKPDQKLSSSFSLPLDSSTGPKKTLLNVIHRTEKGFTGCKNYSPDLKFRSFVCQGFNLYQLSDWIKLIVSHPTLIDDLYQPNSFIATTKFRPVIQCLDRLSSVPRVSPIELPASFYNHTNIYSPH